MATAPTYAPVSATEYLNTSYRPDLEYVDGVLVEKSVPTFLHGLLQLLLGSYLRQFEKTCRFKVVPEVRTEIVKLARYRLPDILLCATPVRVERVLDVTPLAVIEILSPTDTIKGLLERFRDFDAIGVTHIILLDPEKSIAYRFENGSLIETKFKALEAEGRTIPFDSEAIFDQLRTEYREATAAE